jgi:hypothetical protein
LGFEHLNDLSMTNIPRYVYVFSYLGLPNRRRGVSRSGSVTLSFRPPKSAIKIFSDYSGDLYSLPRRNIGRFPPGMEDDARASDGNRTALLEAP